MTRDSESFFNRALAQKTTEAQKAVEECLDQYLAHGDAHRQTAGQDAYAAVDRLRQMLHPSDRPGWLNELHQSLRVAGSNPKDAHGRNAVKQIATQYYPQLMQHQWSDVASESASGVEFDAVYEKCRSECHIQEVFDELVRHLRNVVASEAIDSVKALRQLEELIATLHAARNGSYFATHGAWSFLTSWLRNTGWELLGGIPVLGSAVKGLRKTLDEGTSRMNDLDNSIQACLKARFEGSFFHLECRPPALLSMEVPESDDVCRTNENAKQRR